MRAGWQEGERQKKERRRGRARRRSEGGEEERQEGEWGGGGTSASDPVGLPVVGEQVGGVGGADHQVLHVPPGQVGAGATRRTTSEHSFIHSLADGSRRGCDRGTRAGRRNH